MAIMLLTSTIWCGCSDRAAVDNPVSVYGEDIIWQHGDSALYLCRHEWNSIILSNQDPSDLVAALPWRVPTKAEGQLLHKFLIEVTHKQRYLCVDEDGVYWTFLFGSGNVTKAGTKTAYTLRPVRWSIAPRDTTISL